MTIDQTESWAATSMVRDYLDWRGWDSWDGNNSDMRIDIETPPFTTTTNGEWYYDPLDPPKRVRINPNNNCARAIELIGHEWGHALTDHVGFLKTTGPCSINEGLADSFAMMVFYNNWIWNDQFPGCVAPRNALDVLDGGFRNLAIGDCHLNGKIVSHINYLTSYVTTTSTPPFTSTPATVSTDCPAYVPFLVDCWDSRCVTWSNKVPVPYHGRELGYAPIFKLVTGQYGGLYSDTDFDYFAQALTWAGCLYDDQELSKPMCSEMGYTNQAAALAAGLWWSPIFVHYWDTPPPPDRSYNTDARPAFIHKAKSGTTANWAAMFYRGNPSVDSHKIKYTYDQGEISGLTDYPQFVAVPPSAQHVKAGSGISAVKSPYGITPAKELAIFFKDYTSNTLKYITGTRGATSITWDAPQTEPLVQIDQTPVAINFQHGSTNDLFFIYKEATSYKLKKMYYGCIAASDITYGGTTLQSKSAPTAVVAQGRLWVFFRWYGGPSDPENDVIYYTTSTDGEFFTTLDKLEDTETLWAPEAIHYRPFKGIFPSGRIWIFYKRPFDNSKDPEDQAEGTRMISFIPGSAGGITKLSIPVFLHQTKVPPSPYEPYHSAFQWGPVLRLYHPREESGQQQGGVWPMWKIEKYGEG